MYPMEQTGVTPLQSAFIVIAAWFGFSFLQTLCALILPIGLKAFKKINYDKNIFFLPILTACLYVILEWVQSWFLSGLTWAKLSISQYKNLFFIQSVSIFGTYFTSFVIIFINASIALYILNKYTNTDNEKIRVKAPFRRRGCHEVTGDTSRTTSEEVSPAVCGRHPLLRKGAGEYNPQNNLLILAAILLYFANSYFGFFRIYLYDAFGNDNPKITAQIVQGNISSYEKWKDGGSSFEIYAGLMEEYRDENTDICVFPETAIPARVKKYGDLYNNMRYLAVKNNLTLFTGAIYCDNNNPDEEKRYNAIMAFDKNYEFIQPYGKRHLVPFGEYLPLDNIITKVFPFVSNISMFDSVLTQGESSGIMTVNGVNYGGLVCFDSIFPELARKSVKDGADILIVVTNDSWFRDSTAIYQHNAQAVLRAVENNRYVIRAANTGVSSFISPIGEILRQSSVLKREVLAEEVGIVKNKTIYTLCGDIILYLSWAYIAFCVIIKIKQRKAIVKQE